MNKTQSVPGLDIYPAVNRECLHLFTVYSKAYSTGTNVMYFGFTMFTVHANGCLHFTVMVQLIM